MSPLRPHRSATTPGGHTIHLAYSGGDHYDSVRWARAPALRERPPHTLACLRHDSDDGRGMPIRVGLDLQLQDQGKASAGSAAAKGASTSGRTLKEKVVCVTVCLSVWITVCDCACLSAFPRSPTSMHASNDSARSLRSHSGGHGKHWLPIFGTCPVCGDQIMAALWLSRMR